MILTKKFEFEAAHKLLNYKGKCENLHGHSYKLIIRVEGTPDSNGIVVDFTQLDRIVKENVIYILDHSYLNKIIRQPTAENIAIWVWNKLKKKLTAPNFKLYEVEVWESSSSGVIYKE